jgi:hypothetical protein
MDALTSPLAVGTTFDTIQLLRDTCAAYAINQLFKYRVVKSNQSRYTIACKADEFLWRLHASTVKASFFCRIKTYNDEHTCFGLDHNGHAQAKLSFIAKHIFEKVKDQPNYRPVDIVKDVHRELSVRINYNKA